MGAPNFGEQPLQPVQPAETKPAQPEAEEDEILDSGPEIVEPAQAVPSEEEMAQASSYMGSPDIYKVQEIPAQPKIIISDIKPEETNLPEIELGKRVVPEGEPVDLSEFEDAPPSEVKPEPAKAEAVEEDEIIDSGPEIIEPEVVVAKPVQPEPVKAGDNFFEDYSVVQEGRPEPAKTEQPVDEFEGFEDFEQISNFADVAIRDMETAVASAGEEADLAYEDGKKSYFLMGLKVLKDQAVAKIKEVINSCSPDARRARREAKRWENMPAQAGSGGSKAAFELIARRKAEAKGKEEYEKRGSSRSGGETLTEEQSQKYIEKELAKRAAEKQKRAAYKKPQEVKAGPKAKERPVVKKEPIIEDEDFRPGTFAEDYEPIRITPETKVAARPRGYEPIRIHPEIETEKDEADRLREAWMQELDAMLEAGKVPEGFEIMESFEPADEAAGSREEAEEKMPAAAEEEKVPAASAEEQLDDTRAKSADEVQAEAMEHWIAQQEGKKAKPADEVQAEAMEYWIAQQEGGKNKTAEKEQFPAREQETVGEAKPVKERISQAKEVAAAFENEAESEAEMDLAPEVLERELEEIEPVIPASRKDKKWQNKELVKELSQLQKEIAVAEDLADKEAILAEMEEIITEKIAACRNFRELFQVLNSFAGIRSAGGKIGYQENQYWKDKINQTRNKEVWFTEITNTYGLRDKVIELTGKEQQFKVKKESKKSVKKVKKRAA